MKVFISWSGEPSRSAAAALRDWIPYLLQSVEPWMSETDLEAGVRWSSRIQQELSEIRFGIICVTPTNMQSPWLLFESGALAKALQDTYVCPYLVDLDPPELKGPLALFQAKRAERDETRSLVHTINKALGNQAIESQRLDTSFDRWWPDLEDKLKTLPRFEGAGRPARRSPDDMLEEVLLLARTIEKQTRVRESSNFELSSLADLYKVGSPFEADLYRHWLSRSISSSDRDELKSIYTMLRDRLAEIPRESREREDTARARRESE